MAKRTASTGSRASASEESLQLAMEQLKSEQRERRRRRKIARQKREARERDAALLASVQMMRDSVAIMKWCLVGITSIMFLGVVLAVWTLMALSAEVARVKTEVQKFEPQIQRIVDEANQVAGEVERVRENLRNPMQSIGSAFGKELDDKLKSYLNSRLSDGE